MEVVGQGGVVAEFNVSVLAIRKVVVTEVGSARAGRPKVSLEGGGESENQSRR